MEVLLLGPLEVVAGQRSVPLGARKERALCAALALRVGQVVPVGELIDSLWGRDPPATAAKTLQGYISRLRRALGPDVITTGRPGYRLLLPDDAVDGVRFPRLIEHARRQSRAGSTEAAVASYAEALGLWRGLPVPELEPSEMGRREQARLVELRHAAREEMLEARVAVGEHHAAVADLEALVAEVPLRERAWELLMLALYRAGRQADALRTYQKAREHLVGHIGVEPGTGLRDLEAAIIAQDPALQAPPASGAGSAAGGGAPSRPPDAGMVTAPNETPARGVGITDGAPRLRSNLAWAAASAYPFAGREAEIEKLDGLWQVASASAVRHGVLIGGDAGIGKTRLVAEAAAAVDAADGLVLFGACEDGLGAPYQPFVEALTGFARGCPPERLGALLGPLGSELTRLVPELRAMVAGLDAPIGADPNTERHRLFEAVSEVLERVAEVQPVLLVLDDLQWATTPTLLLLRHLLNGVRPARLLIVATYRPTDLDRVHPLLAMLADLRRQPHTRRISLDGLDEDSTITLASEAADHDLAPADKALIRRLHQECGGNPFFFWTMLAHLVETGMIVRRDGRWTHAADVLERPLPEGIREVIAQRLSSLDGDTNELLRIASLLGAGFDYRVLAAVAEADPESVLDALELAGQRGIVGEHDREFGRFVFAHDLVRRSLEEELSTTRRARLHWRTATVLTAHYGHRADDHLDELARHATEGALAGDLDRARDLVHRAGNAALDALAFEEAAEYYDDALGFVGADDLDRRYHLLLARGRALHRAGNPAYQGVVRDAIDVARRRGDADQFAEAVLELHHYAYLMISAVSDAELRTLLHEGLDERGPMEPGVRARMTSALAMSLSLSEQREQAIELSREAVRLARHSDDDRVLAEVLTDHSWAISGPDTVDERVALGSEAAALSHSAGDDIGLLNGLNCLGGAYLELGALDRAAATLDEGLKLAEYLRRPNAAWGFKVHQGSLLMLQSDVATVEAHGEHLEAFGTELGVHPDTLMAVSARHLFAARYEQGRLQEFEEPLTAMVEKQPDMPWGILLGVISTETGRPDAAVAVLDRYRARRPHRDIAWMVFHMLASIVVAEVGDTDMAAELYGDMLPFAGRNSHDGAGTLGPVDLALGRLATALGDSDRATVHYEAAATLCERWHAPMWAAHASYEHARLAVRNHGPGSREAVELLTRCTTIAQATGQRRLIDLAATLRNDGGPV